MNTAAIKRTAARLLPARRTVRADLLAGLPGAIASVPDGMASGVLVGISPVHGLYASFAAPIAGGFSTSTRLMVVTTTTAAALAAGSAVSGVSPGDRVGAVYLITVLAGVFMIVAGVLRLGRLTRFVPHSVMTGFLTGVAINIILGQLPDLLGDEGHGSTNLQKAWDALTHASSAAGPSLLTGAAAIVIAFGLTRTPLASVASVGALLVPTIGVIALGADSVARVKSAGAIPRGLPLPQLPKLSELGLNTITGALAIMVIVLVQGAGVAESVPNRGPRRADANRDFAGQGIGNVAAGLFGGLPVGGSVGQTALNVAAGARTRWASIFSGIWMLLILLVFASAVGLVALPTLAAVLVVAAIGALRFGQIETVLRTSWISRIALSATFVATLLLPVAVAVGVGVTIALLLQLNQDALDLRVVALTPVDDGRFAESPAPRRLTDGTVLVLDVYGSLFYAGAKTLQNRLPPANSAHGAAVVLRLRGRPSVGATFVSVLDDYVARLRDSGNRMFLAGLDPALYAQLTRFDRFGDENIDLVRAEPVLGVATQRAYDDADEWVRAQRPDAGDGAG